MRLLFLLLVIAGTIGGGAFLVKSGKVHLPGTITVPVLNKQGSVKGVSVTNFSPISDAVGSLAKTAVKAGNAIGIQTIQKGQEFASNIANTPSASADVINVGQVVASMQSQVQNLPATLAKQAQLEYCKQVFATATASAK